MSANKRRTGRARKKEPNKSGAELQDAGAEQKASEQEVGSPVEIETDKPKTEAEAESSESKLILPADLESERKASDHPQVEPARESEHLIVKPETGQKSGGKRVAENREGIFDSFNKINESVFSLDGMKKAAAWYIETSEKLANQALELQERATGWAKDTPFAALFEAQHSLARKFVERSANAARTLWQIHPAQ